MQEAPDEFAHYWVIKFIHDHLQLPGKADVIAGGASAVYGSLPQLGYLPHLLISWLMPASELALYARFGSLLAGAFLLYSAYKIGILLFPDRQLNALALPLAITLHPQLIFLHCYSNNDSTSSALAGLIILFMLQCLKNGNSFRKTILLGFLAGWLTLSKYAGLAILPVVALSLVASSWLHGTSLASQLPALALAAALSGSMCALWFARNYQEFDGDFMGTKTMYKTWATTFHRDLNYYLSPSRIIKDFRWWRMTFFSYWGLFGYMSKYLWRPVYFGYLAAVLTATAGWCAGCFTRVKQPKDKQAICAWVSLALIVILNLVAMIWASIYNLGGPQGRYLFTSEIPIMALIIGGMSRFNSPANKWLVVSFIAFNAGVSLYSWLLLFNNYGGWHSTPL